MSSYRYSNYYRPSLFGGFSFFPPVIKALMISNGAVFFLSAFFGMFILQGHPIGEYIDAYLALHPLGRGFQVWQTVTYMFMHGGIFHILFNMLWLWMFGMELENLWGSRRFFVYYMLCGIGAGIAHLVIAPMLGQGGPIVGASGAIYGVLVAFGFLFPNRPVFIYFLLPIRARYFVAGIIAIDLLSSMMGPQSNVAHLAHLGGAAMGFVLLLLEKKGVSWKRFVRKPQMTYIPPQYHYTKPKSVGREDISDATYEDIHPSPESGQQQRVDEILDKINQSGYQSLTDEEKRFLFEASKRLN